MLKKLIITLLLVHSGSLLFAQNADSLTLVNARWSHKRIAPKIKLKTFHFNANDLFSANENISYLEVRNNRSSGFALAAETKELKPTSIFAMGKQAIAAINGTFFDMKNGGSVDYIKVDGQVLDSTRLERNHQRARHQRAAVVLDQGKLNVIQWDGRPDWEKQLTAANVMITGPLLTFNGTDEILDSAKFTTGRNPRTAIGLKPDGRVILLTVDGRSKHSAGMSLKELCETMRWLGCTTSINLDGGGSTTLWVKDQGVVNYPTDNKKWDHQGERKVANVVLVVKRH